MAPPQEEAAALRKAEAEDTAYTLQRQREIDEQRKRENIAAFQQRMAGSGAGTESPPSSPVPTTDVSPPVGNADCTDSTVVIDLTRTDMNRKLGMFLADAPDGGLVSVSRVTEQGFCEQKVCFVGT